MLMAADQRKKRLSSNSVAGCSSRELHRTKKKSLASLQFGSPMKPHIYLELDGSQMRVVAKKEQIGLSRRDLAPYSSSVSYHHSTLADVITLPKYIFSLENLESVFSYEVWREYLSEDERAILSQFLPKGVDTEEIVQSLFAGSNFSFGNPVLKWSNMLASGNLHPDAIIQRDRSLLANQKAYCSKLKDYHNGMLRNLLQLKEMWDGCQDPVEFVPNISRTSNPTGNSTFASTDEYKLQNPDPNLGESSESLSTMEYDHACSSDDHAVIVTRNGELQRRRGLKLDNTRSPLLTSDNSLKDVVRHGKGENFRNCNILDDGAKYMACVRITKKQFELLKSMKQPGKGIQSKSVKHVLGNLSSYCVQPFAMFEEEERRKLHEQWLLVVNTVSQASAEWRARQTHKEQIAQLLCQDIKEKVKQVLQDEESTGCKQTDLICYGRTDPTLNMEEYENTVAALAEVHDMVHHNTVGGGFKSNDVGIVGSVENDGTQTTDLIASSHEDSMLDMASENDAQSNDIHASYVHSSPDFLCTSNPSIGILSRGDTQSAAGGFWQTAKLSLPSHQSTFARGYTNDITKLPCRDPQSNLDRHPQFLHSESELLENGNEPGMPCSLTNQRSFSAYQNEDRNGLLLQSIFSSPELSSYKAHQKEATPYFQQAQNALMGNVKLPVQYQGSLHQVHPLGTRLKIDEQYYMNQHLSNNMPDLSRSNTGSSFPVQEHLPPFHMQDWHTNSVGMAVPLQIQSHAGDFSTPNWYSPSQQIHGGWSNPPNEVSILSQSIRNETNNNDESLFSVLSQCKELRSSTCDHRMDSIGEDIAPGAFGLTGGSIGNINVIPQVTHPLGFFRGTDVAPSLPPNSVGWVNIPQQTSSLPDPLGKPFLRSWKQ